MENNKKGNISDRLSEAIARAGQSRELSGEEEKKILKQRAQELSRPSKAEAPKEESLEVLSFQLAGELYALETKYIKEVFSIQDITPLPLTPGFVKGIMNIRGEIVSVLDLKIFFDLPQSGITDLNKVILVFSGDMRFGILTDKVLEVSKAAIKRLHSDLHTIKGIREEYLRGVTEEGLIILDGGKILSDKRLIINEEV